MVKSLNYDSCPKKCVTRSGIPFSMRLGVLGLCFFLISCTQPRHANVPPSFVDGAVQIKAPNHYREEKKFNDNIRSSIQEMSEDPYLRQVWLAARHAPAPIVITPMSDDPKSWHRDGSRTRSHTEPMDHLPKRYGRSKPTPAIIFINPNRVDPWHRTYGRGTFAHELVHAIDLAYGRYHRNVRVREWRAVFVQNIWRDLRSYKLRNNYHGRFPTLEYQSAKKSGMIPAQLDEIFSGDDFSDPDQS